MFDVIYSDPPWFYNPRRNVNTRFGGGIYSHYQPMKEEEICALPMGEVATPSSLLFLWATPPRLEVALRVMKAWGFSYKTIGFTWAKTNPKSGTPFFGIGHYTKSNTELCLLGSRGSSLLPATNSVSQLVIAPRRQHSRKPDEVRRAIDAMYPDSRKLELFARETTAGWTCLGNEIDGKDINECLLSLKAANAAAAT